MTYPEFLLTLQLSQGISIVGAVLLRLNRTRLSMFFLALFLLNLLYLAFSCFLFLDSGPQALIDLKGTTSLSMIAIGPLLWLYLRSELIPNYHFSFADLKNLVPFVIAFAIIWCLATLDDTQRIIDLYGPFDFSILAVLRLLAVASLLYYAVLSYQFAQKHKSHLSEVSSLPDIVSMRWAYGVIGLVIGIALLGFLVTLIGVNSFLLTVAMEFILVGLLLMAVFSHSYSKVFYSFPQDTDYLRSRIRVDEEDNRDKYKTSPLDEQQLRDGVKRIEKLLHDNHPDFYKPSFRLSDLSKLIKVPTYLTSQIINQGLDKSFYDLVNEQRIRKACEILRESSNGERPIIEVAYEVGYNSKSAFNTAFKKYMNMTPSEFKKSDFPESN